MTGLAMTRRKLLTALLLAPPALAACSTARSVQATAPDPLIALAAAARSDAALAAAVIAATPSLAGRVAPLRDARTAHAAALEAGVAQQAGATTTPQSLDARAFRKPRHTGFAAHGRRGGRGRGGEGRDDRRRAPRGPRRVRGRVLHDLRGGVGVIR